MIYVPLIDGVADRENMSIYEPEAGDWALYDSTFDGLYKPKWIGEQWEEGATPEEIEAMKPEPEQPIKSDKERIAELEQLLADLASITLGV